MDSDIKVMGPLLDLCPSSSMLAQKQNTTCAAARGPPPGRSLRLLRCIFSQISKLFT